VESRITLTIHARHQIQGKTQMEDRHFFRRGITCQRESTNTATIARLAAVRSKFRAEHAEDLLPSCPLNLNNVVRVKALRFVF